MTNATTGTGKNGFYAITSRAAGELGIYPASWGALALDGMARVAGYSDHAAQCAAMGKSYGSWTLDAGRFARGECDYLLTKFE